jgi:hypothetical protein
VVDESDDADGHRIYFNPWATADDDEDEDEDEEDWSGPEPPASPASPDGW